MWNHYFFKFLNDLYLLKELTNYSNYSVLFFLYKVYVFFYFTKNLYLLLIPSTIWNFQR